MTMDSRNLKNDHHKGDPLMHGWVNAVSKRLRIRPSDINAYESSTAMSSREYIREATIQFDTEDDLAPHSIFAAVGFTGQALVPRFKAKQKGWNVFTNGPYEVKADQQGVASPLDFYVPALVKQTTDPDYKPKAGDICGPNEEFVADTKHGGLLCMGHDGSDDLIWVVRFDGPVHALAKPTGNVTKRSHSDFQILDNEDNNFFEAKTVKAFNVHHAGLASLNHVILSYSVTYGLVATKWNGGMWLGVTDAAITGGSSGNVTLDDTGETIQVTAPPDGLGEGKKVNCIEYEYDGFHAYQIEC